MPHTSPTLLPVRPLALCTSLAGRAALGEPWRRERRRPERSFVRALHQHETSYRSWGGATRPVLWSRSTRQDGTDTLTHNTLSLWARGCPSVRLPPRAVNCLGLHPPVKSFEDIHSFPVCFCGWGVQAPPLATPFSSPLRNPISPPPPSPPLPPVFPPPPSLCGVMCCDAACDLSGPRPSTSRRWRKLYVVLWTALTICLSIASVDAGNLISFSFVRRCVCECGVVLS